MQKKHHGKYGDLEIKINNILELVVIFLTINKYTYVHLIKNQNYVS